MFYLCKDIAVRRPLRSTSRVWADVKCEVEVQYLWGFWEGGSRVRGRHFAGLRVNMQHCLTDCSGRRRLTNPLAVWSGSGGFWF